MPRGPQPAGETAVAEEEFVDLLQSLNSPAPSDPSQAYTPEPSDASATAAPEVVPTFPMPAPRECHSPKPPAGSPRR